MAKSTLRLTELENGTGKKLTTNISDVNNEANSQTLKTLATKLNALTMNEYYQADRVQTINVDTEEVTTLKQGTIEIVDNPTINKTSSGLSIPMDQFIINGERLTNVPENNILFGTTYNNYNYSLFASKTLNAVLVDTNTSPPTGTYKTHIGLQPMNGYTAAYLYKELTVS